MNLELLIILLVLVLVLVCVIRCFAAATSVKDNSPAVLFRKWVIWHGLFSSNLISEKVQIHLFVNFTGLSLVCISVKLFSFSFYRFACAFNFNFGSITLLRNPFQFIRVISFFAFTVHLSINDNRKHAFKRFLLNIWDK